ncbi:MAG: aa3-type cytochrome c oxidase subunit IV [Devosia sp.]|jgi:hypothetical protein|uniref:aa3-type cytochrome c oxidase subunit IV n=1 Tax=Devosia sp. TaxID=1871048 RepID=UPI0037BFF937
MAKKPAKAAVVEDLPPAMDYAQHNATYEGFIQLIKWGIVAVALIVLALYAFIEGHQPLIGWLLLLLIPVGAVGLAVTGTTRRS